MIQREQFYEEISTELLGCFCYYIQRKLLQIDGYDSDLLKEIEYIHEVAKKREISVLKLYQIGYSISKNEVAITTKEMSFLFNVRKK